MVWRSSNSRLQVASLVILNVFLLLIFGVTRITWNRLSHSAEVKFRFADRSTLYPGESKLKTVARIGRDALNLEFQNVADGALEVSQGGKLVEKVTWNIPGQFTIKLLPGESEAQIKGTSVKLNLRFEPSKSMRDAGYNQAKSEGYVTIARSTVDVWSVDKTSVKAWTLPNLNGFLPESLGLRSLSANDLILNYDKWVQGKKGVPNDATQKASPEVTLANLDSGQSKGWCNNLSKGFLPLATRAGIVARQVGSHDLHLNDVWLGNHQLNEWFNPKSRKWQVVDFTLDIRLVTQNGVALDADQFSRVIKSGGEKSLRFSIKQTIKPVPWLDLDPALKNSIQEYYGKGQRFSYHLPGTPTEPRIVLVDDAQFSRVDTLQMFQIMRVLCALALLLLILCTFFLFRLIWTPLNKQTRSSTGSQ